MTGYQRRNMIRHAWLGAAITACIAVFSLAGLFTSWERRLSDLRTAWCQFHVTPPSDALVEIDIDDSALSEIHRWPWPRGIWADVLDELRLAGSRVVAFDILFAEAQNGSQGASAHSYPATPADVSDTSGAQPMGDDAQFAQAIAAHGNVILPSTFSFTKHRPAYDAAVHKMRANLALLASYEAYQQAAAINAGVPLDGASKNKIRKIEAQPEWHGLDLDTYLRARRRALFDLLVAKFRDHQAYTLTQAQQHFFPWLDPAVTSGSLLRLLDEQFRKARAYADLQPRSFWIYRPLDSLPEATDILLPTEKLAAAAQFTAFVDVTPDPGGVVRRVDSVVRFHGFSYSQLGIALAQAYQLPDSPTLIFKDDGLAFINDKMKHPIPLDAQGRVVIPWTGKVDDWQSVIGRQRHLAVGYVWEAAGLAHSLNANRRTADRAIYDLYRLALDQSKAKELAKTPLDFENDNARALRVNSVLAELKELGYPDALTDAPVETLTGDEKTILAAIAALRIIPSQNQKLASQLAARRADLYKRLNDKAVLVGFTASGLGDVITTPLHTRCPGVVAHSAIFNAIMTGSFWTQASWTITLPVVVLMGLAGTLMAMWLAPAISAPMMLLLLLIYTLLNGLVIFDRWDMQLMIVGPMLAGSGCWAGCTFMGLILERRERARITRRFQNYVDPTLVNYVIENPDKARLQGEARTMSVVFTDLEGFTKLSSTIHERVVPVINRYLELMIPPIHGNNGYVNKFLGDGIMFFFGAPRENANHAADALNAIMQMQKCMGPFNEQLKADGLPGLRMRVGMATGKMIVGDAGSLQRSDYTVMGDQVNFAARLESANKATGTSILINETAAEFVQDQYLLRPIGRLQVVGRSQAAMCFEPLCMLTEAGYPRQKLVQMSHDLIQAYTEKRWQDCLTLADELVAFHPESLKLVELYRLNIARQQQQPTDDFDGRIELTSK